MNLYSSSFWLVGLFCLPFLFSCENEIEKIKALTQHEEFPDLYMRETVISYTDSARIKVQLDAPLILKFALPEDPYTEFPDGMHIRFFNKRGELTADLRANYARQFEEQNLWKASGDVVAHNEKGEILNTEELFWDQEQRIIYSDEFTKITSNDGVYYGKDGFESDESFSKWKLKGSSGEVDFKEE